MGIEQSAKSDNYYKKQEFINSLFVNLCAYFKGFVNKSVSIPTALEA